MRSFFKTSLVLLSSMAGLLAPVSAEKMLLSHSLNSCQANSSFSASLFNVVYTPENNSAIVQMVATSSVEGKVKFDITLSAYGHRVVHVIADPCDLGDVDLAGLCPMRAGKNSFTFKLPVPEDAAQNIPGIAYTIPDLDADVRAFVNMTRTGESVACVQAAFSNGKTVDLLGVKWATAIIAGLALIASAVVSGLGHTNTAAHVASNAVSLFGYFQAQAMVGLVGIPLPPVVQAWTQNFQWSMGIIRVGFMQDIFTWYQRATGGTPTNLFSSLRDVSVQVQKRSLDLVEPIVRPAVNLFNRSLAAAPASLHQFAKRANIEAESGGFVVFGIQRVAFKAKIETTNLFMTGLTFFCLFLIFTVIVVVAFKGICELCVKQKWLKSDKFLEFRNGWLTILKGILFRVALIGFPQMAILCLWEFTQVDSVAEVVLAVFIFFGLVLTLGWGASKVIRIARRSVAMHRNPAYILFSDPQALNKWGFLYIQFRASAYYYIVPTLFFILIKAMFLGLSQRSGIAQAIGFIIIEAAALITASVLRPWMDKPTNSFNIAICVVNFLNAIFLLIMTNVFGAPRIVVGVVGVVLFILNAAFSLVLLLMIIISTSFTFFRKNPDARYHFMADDRASFMKSQTQLNTTTELDALAATARGDKAGYKAHMDLDDNESLSEDSIRRRTDPNASQVSFHNGPRSPINPAMPLFPAGGQRPQSPFRSASPSPYNRSGSSLAQNRSQNNASPASFRPQQQNNNAGASPWQRGAGYD